LGYSDEEILGLNYKDITPEKWRADEENIINSQVLTQGYSDNYEKEYIRKDGTTFPVELRSYLVKDDDGKPAGMWAFVRDITGLKRAEALLIRSEHRYRSLVETITEGMAIVDFDENIIFANSAACRIFGYTHEELIGLNLKQIIISEDIDKILAETQKRKHGVISKYEFSIRRKDKEIRHLFISVTPYQDVDGNIEGAVGLFSDITEVKLEKQERKKLKEQLERAQRMESLGILAGGVAHDLNNILGPLVAYPEMILMKLPPDSPARKQVEMLGKSAREAADVIQDLLTLARRGRYEMKPIDINEVIDSYLESANLVELKSRNPNVMVESKLDRNIGYISGSIPHLLKVIMNLVINAFDAMPSGGKLTIKTSRDKLEKLYGGLSNIEKGEYVIIQVCDTGVGIEEKNLKYIFEPYFSKKEMGSSGSGLGLSVVYGIVKDHKGYYDVNSTVGVGTEFILYFPLCPAEIRKKQEYDNIISGTETILVIDDVREQREIARELLSSLGYTVITVDSGREAVKFLSKHCVDIIMLDMIMEKDFDGLDTYTNILKYHPSQKAVIVSGFSATDRVTQAMELGAGQYIKKPYTLKQLGIAIRTELDKNKVPASAK
ncbi:MAG: PAS domain S-box protein, partial [Candidatus Zixiibacteriota bacterium]